ncbi:MAG: acetylornithine deacetylase [Rhodobacteraceae bacterium]|jgi:acetylornithine deacetylase|nr:acetylornithine deacetylase [Paracoccaceae bacterium]
MTQTLARDLLDRLVAFPSVSRDSNLPLIDFVEAWLAGQGVTATRVWNDDRTKAGLFAQIGPSAPGGIVLSGHTDVVPVDGQAWTSDPWTVTERDGRLYGRGTADMKGFVALSLAAVPAALSRPLTRPLQLALSWDEEVGCVGAPPLIDAMRAALPQASAVIVGEPSMLRPVTAHKGGAGFHVTVRGHEVHSSLLPQGVSAIMEAARLIGWLNDRNATLRATPPSPVAALFDPPHTTLHTGLIRGGTAGNITAGECTLSLEFRCVPDEDPDRWRADIRAAAAAIEAAMRRVHPGCAIHLHEYFGLPPLAPETDGAAEHLIRRLTGDNGSHTVSYGTEAGHFQARGYSTVVCGPGDIAQAHQADEFISVAQFEAGGALIDRLVDTLAE